MIGRIVSLFAATEVASLKQRVQTTAVAAIAIGFTAVLGIFFLLVAAFLAAAFRWGVIEAALGFGFAFLILSAIFYAIFRVMMVQRQKERERKRANEAAMMASVSALAAIPSLTRKALGGKKGVTPLWVLLAGVAGFALMRSFSGDKDDAES